MHEGLIWVFHLNLRVPPSLIHRAQTALPTHKSLCLVAASLSDSSFPSSPTVSYTSTEKHTRERTNTEAHVSIHGCRAVRSNLDSHREWIVMQRGGRGGHKQDVRELLLVSARPASFFPVESSSALLQVFFLTSHLTTIVAFFLSLFSPNKSQELQSKMQFWEISTVVE